MSNGDFEDLGIDWDTVETQTDYTPLEGKFIAELVAAEVNKKNIRLGKAGVKHTYELLEGRVGMKVIDYFNLKHPTHEVQVIGQGQYKKRCQDLGFSEVPAFAHEAIGRKVILKLKAEASNQLNPNTGEPYVNSVVKNSWPVDVIGKPTAAAPVATSVDDDPIPF